MIFRYLHFAYSNYKKTLIHQGDVFFLPAAERSHPPGACRRAHLFTKCSLKVYGKILQIYDGMKKPPFFSKSGLLLLCSLANDVNINCTHLAAVLRISFYVEGNLLSLIQGLEAVNHDGREMYEYIIAALIVRDEAVALLSVEPFNGTRIH